MVEFSELREFATRLRNEDETLVCLLLEKRDAELFDSSDADRIVKLDHLELAILSALIDQKSAIFVTGQKNIAQAEKRGLQVYLAPRTPKRDKGALVQIPSFLMA